MEVTHHFHARPIGENYWYDSLAVLRGVKIETTTWLLDGTIGSAGATESGKLRYLWGMPAMSSGRWTFVRHLLSWSIGIWSSQLRGLHVVLWEGEALDPSEFSAKVAAPLGQGWGQVEGACPCFLWEKNDRKPVVPSLWPSHITNTTETSCVWDWDQQLLCSCTREWMESWKVCPTGTETLGNLRQVPFAIHVTPCLPWGIAATESCLVYNVTLGQRG